MCTFMEQIRYGLDCLYLKGKGLWQLSLVSSFLDLPQELVLKY